MTSRFPRRAILALLAGASTAGAPLRAAADEVLVFAAASLVTALDAIAADWRAATGHEVTISYAGTSALARQIQQGAPADLFISASTEWMDALAASGDLREGSRRDLLGNRLVLIGHGRDAAPVTIDPALDLGAMLGDERLAMALVDAVPAGIYGKAALQSLGLWDGIAARVAQTDNVRAALALVALGEAPYGIVYATDAAASDNVSVIGVFPADSHPPITYPAALLAAGTSAVAGAFLDHLAGPEATAIWAANGFQVHG